MPQMSDMVASEKELRQRDPDVLRNGIRLILHELEVAKAERDYGISEICKKLLAGEEMP